MKNTAMTSVVLTPVALALAATLAGPASAAHETSGPETSAREMTPQDWYRAGAQAVQDAQRLKPQYRRAKNVILFIGDGMGVSTVTAARIFDGQNKGLKGEENQLTIDRFPHLALSKTYSVNQQTPDSAPTMTAMVTGVKTNDGVLAVDQYVTRRESSAAVIAAHSLPTILEMAEARGLATGIVSTARITHATPAATYAHSSERDWEADADQPAGTTVPDIARQLIEFKGGDGLEVALGGGRSKFYPNTEADPEYPASKGSRKDGRRLHAEWVTKHPNAAYVWNKAQFDAIDPRQTDHLLGLFERSHAQYELDRPNDAAGEPSIAEMTAKAIDILGKNRKGFFLMVEGGRIDHAHHAGNAKRALADTVAMDEAVKVALAKTDARDTLIVVSADHSHVFTIAGYPKRGNPILGKVVSPGKEAPDYELAADGLPYTTLSYANGRGYHALATGGDTVYSEPIAAGRVTNLTSVDTIDEGFHQEALVPLDSETHAGEDVAIYAHGPRAYLVHGMQEQNVIFHVMREGFGF